LLSDTGFANPRQDVDAVQFSVLPSTARLKKRHVPVAVIPAKAGTQGEHMDVLGF